MNIENEKAEIISELINYQSFDEIENAHQNQIISFLELNVHPFNNLLEIGHITASCVACNAKYTQVLMIWHKKLERWLQPGGHCEPDIDNSVFEASKRELVEETGITAASILQSEKKIFDVDVHLIPEKKGFPAHYHYDIRYLFEIDRNASLHPETLAQWMPIDELISMNIPSLARFARKLKQKSALI